VNASEACGIDSGQYDIMPKKSNDVTRSLGGVSNTTVNEVRHLDRFQFLIQLVNNNSLTENILIHQVFGH
jgi:hypothetical protein